MELPNCMLILKTLKTVNYFLAMKFQVFHMHAYYIGEFTKLLVKNN